MLKFGKVTFSAEPQPVCRNVRGSNLVIPFYATVEIIGTGLSVKGTAWLRRDPKTLEMSSPVSFPGLTGQRAILVTDDPSLPDRFSDHVDLAMASWPERADVIRRSIKVLKAGPVARATKADGTKSNLVYTDADGEDPTINEDAIANKASILASAPSPATPPKAK